MWKLTINGRVHTVVRPHWIRQMNRLGVTLLMTATEKNAQGVQFNGAVYQLADKELMEGDFIKASIEWVDEEENSDVQELQQVEPQSSSSKKEAKK